MRNSIFLRTLYFSAVLLCLLTCVGGTAVAQDAKPTQPSDPNQLMLLAAKSNGLGGAEMKPWHINASYTQFDGQGNIKSDGTLEEFWVNAAKYKVIFTSGDQSYTAYGTEKGEYTIPGKGMDLLLPFEAQRQFIEPLPVPQDVMRMDYAFYDRDAGSIQITCLRQKLSDGTLVGLTWCLEPGEPILRIRVNGNGPDVLYSNFMKFQGHTIARDLKFSDGDLALIENDKGSFVAHLESIEPLTNIDDAAFVPPSDSAQPFRIAGMSFGNNGSIEALIHNPSVMPRPEKVNVSGGVMQGNLAQKVAPIYPADAKRAGISGTVVLQAEIGLDGHIGELSVISGPDLLQQAALDAVKQWVYRPYLLNGEPVKVRTTINVIFTLGG